MPVTASPPSVASKLDRATLAREILWCGLNNSNLTDVEETRPNGWLVSVNGRRKFIVTYTEVTEEDDQPTDPRPLGENFPHIIFGASPLVTWDA